MPDEKVTFGHDGSYQIGSPVQEMDVEREKQKGAQAGDSTSNDAPAAQAPSAAPAQKGSGPKKFDMSRLRRSAKKAAPKEDAEEPKVEAKEEQPPKPAPEPEPPKQKEPDPIPEPIPVSEPAPEPIPEPAPEPEPEPIPEPAPEPEPAPALAEQPPKAFSLSQLNRKPQQTTPEEAPKESREVAEMSLDSTTRKEPDVKPEPIPEPETAPQPKEESKVSEMKLDSTKTEPAPAPAEPEPETAATAPDFIQNTLEEFLAFTQLEVKDLSTFAKKVAQASVRGGTIWQSKQFELLRAYSCTVAQGRSVPKTAKYMITFGWDVHITTCYVDQNFVVSDGSSNLTCAGICASVQGTPVALSLERKRSAIVC